MQGAAVDCITAATGNRSRTCGGKCPFSCAFSRVFFHAKIMFGARVSRYSASRLCVAFAKPQRCPCIIAMAHTSDKRARCVSYDKPAPDDSEEDLHRRMRRKLPPDSPGDALLETPGHRPQSDCECVLPESLLLLMRVF